MIGSKHPAIEYIDGHRRTAVVARQDLAFLFGAGISIPADFPSTIDITNQVMSGKDVQLDTQERYLIGRKLAQSAHREQVDVVIEFIKILKTEIEDYYRSNSWAPNVNYEQLYFLSRQIADAIDEELENPGLWSLIKQLQPQAAIILNDKHTNISGLCKLADETCKYIVDIASALLRRDPTTIEHLEFISGAIGDPCFRGVHLFTLNHDLLLENYLTDRCVAFRDGFSNSIQKIRYWTPDNPQHSDELVSLWKLHGSIDWFRLRRESCSWEGEAIGIPLSGSPPEAQDGVALHKPDPRPLILCGTFNKIFAYSSEPYAFLHHQFREVLSRTHCLVICGYGFGDKGINSYITNWVYSVFPRKLVIVHPDPAALVRDARGSISAKWENWKARGIVRIVESGVEELTWHALLRELSS